MKINCFEQYEVHIGMATSPWENVYLFKYMLIYKLRLAFQSYSWWVYACLSVFV